MIVKWSAAKSQKKNHQLYENKTICMYSPFCIHWFKSAIKCKMPINQIDELSLSWIIGAEIIQKKSEFIARPQKFSRA